MDSSGTVLITGAAGGVGTVLSARMLELGHRVVLTDARQSALDGVCADLPASAADRWLALQHDVTDEAGWAGVVAASVERFGSLDVLVNNAGVTLRAGIAETSAEDFRRVLDVNVIGIHLGMRTSWQQLARCGAGAIVNIGSVTGQRGWGAAAYTASKWAVRGLTRTAALEFADHGIRVNMVSPGWIDSPMTHAAPPRLVSAVARVTPLGRLAAAGDVVEAVVFLASASSGYITGAELNVDGGLAAGAEMRTIWRDAMTT